jgi:hypothetical protein
MVNRSTDPVDPMTSEAAPSRNGGTRPVPDPTVLTTQQLYREVSALREIIEARLNGNDKIVEQLQTHLDERGAVVSEAVTHLQRLHEEKFRSISVQFAERDTRTEQTSRDSKVAVDAALQAAKEAVGEQNKSSALAIAKSEAATTKQIDAIGTLISTQGKGVDDKIDDIKSRLTTIEGHSKGLGDGWGFIVGAGGLLTAIIIVVLMVINRGAGQ